MRTDVDLDVDALSGSGSDEAREVDGNTKTGKEGKEPRKEPGHSTGHDGNSKIEHRGKEGKGGQVGSKDGKILSSSKSAKEAKTGKGADLAAKTAAFESARKKTRAQQASVVGVVVGGVLIVGALLFKPRASSSLSDGQVHHDPSYSFEEALEGTPLVVARTNP